MKTKLTQMSEKKQEEVKESLKATIDSMSVKTINYSSLDATDDSAIEITITGNLNE